MAVIKLNDYVITKKIKTSTMRKLNPAMYEMARDLREEIVDNAAWAGAYALADRNVYDIEHKMYWVGLQVGIAKVSYNQNRLFPSIGRDTKTWRHTSPSGKHPDDYRDLVNSGNSGWLFATKPAWANSPGFWDDAMAQMPMIVARNLRKYGVI